MPTATQDDEILHAHVELTTGNAVVLFTEVDDEGMDTYLIRVVLEHSDLGGTWGASAYLVKDWNRPNSSNGGHFSWSHQGEGHWRRETSYDQPGEYREQYAVMTAFHGLSGVVNAIIGAAHWSFSDDWECGNCARIWFIRPNVPADSLAMVVPSVGHAEAVDGCTICTRLDEDC